ncbi:hypothetical protein FB45DRAFT_1032701 [Roridomyces roridus]|uniref:Amidohydrolase-related domain-containing protein n=1 Tax=Roridomyces roridus TaxID=1738132 RepID=A0AAD7BI60_9AGAR|nr:hypothetical protein FB45DRAFT_1032701 [Roridomyces roridus]
MKMTSNILAGKLFDPQSRKLVPNQLIVVSRTTGLVVDVSTFSPDSDALLDDPDTVDLRHLIVVPGFVDAHVHFFLHSYAETSWVDQVTKESLAERTVRATIHARKTLMAGYTAVRDLGTEGAEDADIALRKCLSGPNAMIPGPRYFTANRAIVTTGSYGPKSSIRLNTEGIEGVIGAEAADGPADCIRAVRRQIGAGADLIKIYADYPIRSRLGTLSPRVATRSIPTFNNEELKALIDTAHAAGLKIAAHAKTTPAIANLLKLRIDSIEHASDLHTSPALIQILADPECSTTYVPTLAAYYTMAADIETDPSWLASSKSFRAVLAMGLGSVSIACGGDTGVFPHGDNALEMDLMHRLGAPWEWVLRWGTLGGWECISPRVVSSEGDNDVPFGCIHPGWAADIVGLAGDLESDFPKTLRRVEFVMKGGRVYKQDGKEVPM